MVRLIAVLRRYSVMPEQLIVDHAIEHMIHVYGAGGRQLERAAVKRALMQRALGGELPQHAIVDSRPRVGRPPLPRGQARGELVPVRLTKAEDAMVRAAARGANVPVSRWCADTLAAAAGCKRKRDNRYAKRREG